MESFKSVYHFYSFRKQNLMTNDFRYLQLAFTSSIHQNQAIYLQICF